MSLALNQTELTVYMRAIAHMYSFDSNVDKSIAERVASNNSTLLQATTSNSNSNSNSSRINNSTLLQATTSNSSINNSCNGINNSRQLEIESARKRGFIQEKLTRYRDQLISRINSFRRFGPTNRYLYDKDVHKVDHSFVSFLQSDVVVDAHLVSRRN